MFLLKGEGDEDSEFIKGDEYDRCKNRLFYVNREFLQKINVAYKIIVHILNNDLHKKKVLFYIRETSLRKVKLST